MSGLVSINTAIGSAQRMLEHIQSEAHIARNVEEGGQLSKILPHFEKANLLRTQTIAQQWRKIGRQVLAVHPEIVEETRVATSDKITGEFLRVLPYINPLVIYPEPVEFKSWRKDDNEASMRLLGFFTAGSSSVYVKDSMGNPLGVQQTIHPSNDAAATHLSVVPIFEVLDQYGQQIDMEVDTFSIEFNTTGTMADLVEDVLGRFRWQDQESPLDTTDNRRRRWMRAVMGVIMGSLLYCCSTTLEAEPVPPKVVAKRISKRVVRTPMSFYKVGWTTGAALTRYRQSRERVAPSEQGDLGHQQDPQHRKSHFKMQWYGPRDSWRCERLRGLCNCEGQHKELILVQAYWTHRERLGEEGMNTVRRVPRAARGAARESVETVLTMGQLPAEVRYSDDND